MQFGVDPDPTDEVLGGTPDVVPPATIADPESDVDADTDAEVEEVAPETEKPQERLAVRLPPVAPPSVFKPIAPSQAPETPVSVQVPGLEAEVIPGDLVEFTPGQPYVPKGGSAVDLKDVAARTREKKINPAVERKEETAEHRWRHLLDGLDTTRLVHVRLQKEVHGSFCSAGARYNVDVNHIRAPERLVPYGTGSSVTPQRWLISVAPNTARYDDESAYRQFVFERIGPAPPPGWSLDSPLAFADQEISEDDVATINEVVTALVNNMRAQGMLAGSTPGAAAPAAAIPQVPGGMMNPYAMPFYPPFYPPMPPLARSDDEDRRRRDGDERRRHDEDERRRREDAAERAQERQKAETDRIALETRHRQEMDTIRAALDQQRKDAERRDVEAREMQARLERERIAAEHHSQMTGLTSVIESLKKDVSDMRSGAHLTQQRGSGDWLALAGTIAPIVTNYLAAEREARGAERLQRSEEASRERERSGRENDQMMKLVHMFGESQLNAAKVNGELIQRMQDPSAMMGMTKLLTETMGSGVQMMAQLARSGFGSGGGDHKVDVGGIIGQALETAGTVFGNYTAMKERELELLARQDFRPPVAAMPQPVYVQPTQPVQPVQPMQPAQPAQPQPVVAPTGPAPAATGADDSNKVLKGMVDTFRAAVEQQIEPEKVAKMISAIVYSAESFGIEKSDPRLAQILNALRLDPQRALSMLFPKVDPAYLTAIAKVLIDKYGPKPTSTSTPTPRPVRQAPASSAPSTASTSAPAPAPAPAAAAAPTSGPVTTVTTTAPIVESTPVPPANGGEAAVPPSPPTPIPTPAMPGRRGRGRPRSARTVETRPPIPEPVDPPAPSAPTAV